MFQKNPGMLIGLQDPGDAFLGKKHGNSGSANVEYGPKWQFLAGKYGIIINQCITNVRKAYFRTTPYLLFGTMTSSRLTIECPSKTRNHKMISGPKRLGFAWFLFHMFCFFSLWSCLQINMWNTSVHLIFLLFSQTNHDNHGQVIPVILKLWDWLDTFEGYHGFMGVSWNRGTRQIIYFRRIFHYKPQDWVPKIVKLVYKWLNPMVYGRYNKLVNGDYVMFFITLI